MTEVLEASRMTKARLPCRILQEPPAPHIEDLPLGDVFEPAVLRAKEECVAEQAHQIVDPCSSYRVDRRPPVHPSYDQKCWMVECRGYVTERSEVE